MPSSQTPSKRRYSRSQIEIDYAKLDQRVQSFVRQLSDAVEIEVLGAEECFTFLRRLVNYDRWRIEGRPKSTQFLDYQVANSEIEAERDHLRVGNHSVKVLTMREAIAETRPLVLKALLDIPANFIAVSEWVLLENAQARKELWPKPSPLIFNTTRAYFGLRASAARKSSMGCFRPSAGSLPAIIQGRLRPAKAGAGSQMVSTRSRPTMSQWSVTLPLSTTYACRCRALVGQIWVGMA